MPTYIIPPWQSIHGFPGYSGHPRIIRGCQPIQYPLGRVSTDSPDTLDIPGLSVDANLYNTPLTEYPRIPRILWTSPDYPWMPTYIIPPWQSIHVSWILWTFPDYPWMPTYIIPPWQSIHGFPGYSGHPRTIRGCQPI